MTDWLSVPTVPGWPFPASTRVYAVHVDDLVALAWSRLTRWFTPAECRQYLHLDECPPEP